MNPELLAIVAAVVVLLLTLWAERWHSARIERASRLAFSPTGVPRTWTLAAPAMRAVAMAGLAWGFTLLALLPGETLPDAATETTANSDTKPEDVQRVILLLDVSPSMNIVDSGEARDQRRRDRLLTALDGMFSRIALARTRFSVIAFFTAALPVVTDASDINVIRNVLDNLPLVWSFEPGETNLIEGLKGAAELARDWPPESTTLFICTDGDTTDFSRLPKLPSSIHQVTILAVGDPVIGTFIGNHDSRQQAGILRRLAAELGGAYYNINTQHVPSSAITDLAVRPPQPARQPLSLKDLALIALACGASTLALLPVALQTFGSSWRADRELPTIRRSKRTTREPVLSGEGSR